MTFDYPIYFSLHDVVNSLFSPDSIEDIWKMDKNKCPKTVYEFSNLLKKYK